MNYIQKFLNSCFSCCCVPKVKSSNSEDTKVNSMTPLIRKQETGSNQLKVKPLVPMQGFFYEIQDEKGKVKGHLLGTIHIALSLQQLNPAISQALDQSNYLAFEGDVYKAAKDATEMAIKQMKLPEPMRATIVETALSNIAQYHLDFSIAHRYKNLKIFKELESPDAIQKLTENLKNEQPSQFVPDWKQLMQTGDLDALSKARSKLPPRPENFKRNPDMANKIDEELTSAPEQRGTFIIGVMHLYDRPDGCKGVISLLEEKGWMVRRIIM